MIRPQISQSCCRGCALALILSVWNAITPVAYGEQKGTDAARIQLLLNHMLPINVNTADAKTLATLPGVGPDYSAAHH
jgi:hypothetical protein